MYGLCKNFQPVRRKKGKGEKKERKKEGREK
jgi:hypothetical protein